MASNLATTFAQQGQRTLLVDADLRRAVVNETFELPRHPGLSDVLIGRSKLADAIRTVDVPNLSVLVSGQFPPNPSELLGSPAMRARHLQRTLCGTGSAAGQCTGGSRRPACWPPPGQTSIQLLVANGGWDARWPGNSA